MAFVAVVAVIVFSALFALLLHFSFQDRMLSPSEGRAHNWRAMNLSYNHTGGGISYNLGGGGGGGLSPNYCRYR